MSKAMLYDSSKCTACRGCQVACKQWWELPAVVTTNQGTYENPPDLSAETWNKIRFKEIGNNGTLRWLFTRQACMHCTTAVCVLVCPTYARQYHKLGFTTIDPERCIGCGRCMMYCPFTIPKLGSYDVSPRLAIELATPRSITYKCFFCKDRVEDGLTPACAKTCPPGAIQFGERADLVEKARARVNDLKATYPKTSLYGENELGGLHVMYILTDKPSVHGLPAKPKVGTYPDFDKSALPAWYTQAVDDGKLPAFPSEAQPEWYLQPPEGVTPAKAKDGISWVQAMGWGWLGFGVGAAVVGLSWFVTRRKKQVEEKEESKED